MYNAIYDEMVITGFHLNENFGVYFQYIAPPTFTLELGKTYKVVWDGVEYEVAGQDTGFIASDTVGVGNLAAYGLSGNNEPFAVVWSSTDISFFATDTEDSHTVAVYEFTADEGGEEETPEYNGSIELISGIRPKNNGSFPLVYAPDVMLTDGRRLSEVELDNLGGTSAAVSVDLSAFESAGVIVESFADGSTKTSTVEFDASGNPVKITDGDGNVTTIVW